MNLLLVLTASGLTSGLLLFGKSVLMLYLAALALNLFYSFSARRIPYLDILVNASTHPLRFLLGVTVVGGRTPPLLLLSIFLTAIGFASARRRLEREQPGWQARESLRFYTDRSLRIVELIAFLALVTISILDDSVPGPFYLVTVIIYMVAVTGIDNLTPVKKLFVGIWTRC
jgi:4-hydroxybenzoate polyprenyltransferase